MCRSKACISIEIFTAHALIIAYVPLKFVGIDTLQLYSYTSVQACFIQMSTIIATLATI